jgi:thiamine pyrophosphate-dependent acetolactate synthase large subunit-like protein
MREIVRDYLDGRIPRRAFIKRMSQAGFGIAAAASALKSLEPLVYAQETPAGASPSPGLVTPFEGTGGELLAEQLRAAGIKYLFLGNGSGLGSLCDALVDRPDMQIILGVHEDHCVSMADGYAKASGKPGFVMFSRVATPHATSNMYNAMKDRSSIIVTSDHAETNREGRDGLEDIDDWLETVGQFTKFRWVVHEANRIPEWTMKAFKLATTMPGGPTYLRFPRDVLYTKKVRAGIYPSGTFNIPMTLRPNPGDVEQAARILLEAKSPILDVGYEVWASGASEARASVVRLAETLAIPVTQSTSWAADFPTTHPLFVRSSNGRYPENIDAYLNMGATMDGSASGGGGRLRNAKIIHACVDAGHLGTAYPVHVALAANIKETATALVDCIKSLATSERLAQIREPRQAATERFTKGMRESYEFAAKRRFDQVPLTWESLSFEINAALDRDAYVVEEFGTEGPKSLQWFPFAEGEKTKIGRTTGYALGWGVGASIGVKLARPNNQVVCLQGDGGFLFGQSEALWTMSRYDVPIIVVIFNNRSYNETRGRMYAQGGRQAETKKDMLSYLGDPDVNFVSIASAYNVKGEQVQSREQAKAAMSRAIKATRDGRPYLIDALVERGESGAAGWYPAYSLAKSRTRQV